MQKETYIPLAQLARTVKPKPVNVATVWRWYRVGVKGGLKLETWLVGGRRYTSEEAYQRFLKRINEAKANVVNQDYVSKADKEAEALGL